MFVISFIFPKYATQNTNIMNSSNTSDFKDSKDSTDSKLFASADNTNVQVTKSDKMVDTSKFEIATAYVAPGYVYVTSKDGRSLTLSKGVKPNKVGNTLISSIFGTAFGYGAVALADSVAFGSKINIPKSVQLAIGTVSGLTAAYKWYQALDEHDNSRWIDLDKYENPVRDENSVTNFAKFFVQCMGLGACIIGGYKFLFKQS